MPFKDELPEPSTSIAIWSMIIMTIAFLLSILYFIISYC
jgi:hypothetical protein